MAEIKYNNGTFWTAITANDIGAADLTTANLCSAYLNGCYLYMGTKVVSPNNATEATIFLDADFKTTFHTTDPIACGVAFMNGDYGASGNIVSIICTYITKNISYDDIKCEKYIHLKNYIPDPDKTYASKSGICFDYVSLAAAMLRSLRISTKIITGYVRPDMKEAFMYSRTFAVRRMIDLVTDPSHGYDQAHRDGPNYDCSSAVCEAYGVPHGNTSSIPDIFRSRGAKVLSWDGNASDLEPGDLVGTPGQHVVMYIGGGKVAEFRINERGGITGGRTGDQTGQESRISNWYVPSYGWRYVVSPPGEGQGYDPLDLRYEVHTREDGWLPQVHALDDYAGVRGHAIDAICIHANAGHSIDYQVHTIGGTWLPVVSSKNANHGNDISGYAGIFGKSIDMIRCYAHNDCKSGERAKYRVSPISKDYFPWQYDHETINGQDGFAGVVGQAIDRFQIC